MLNGAKVTREFLNALDSANSAKNTQKNSDRIRRVWDCVAVHRAELLKHYDMQDNAEFILLYKLRQIDVDVEKWTAEPQTQKVVLKE